jgi:hypothetical protein
LIPINIVLVVVLQIEGGSYGLEDDDEHENEYESNDELNWHSTIYKGPKKFLFRSDRLFLAGGGTDRDPIEPDRRYKNCESSQIFNTQEHKKIRG